VRAMKNKRKPNPYDISRIYSEMELFLLASMARNLRRHKLDELAKGFTWEMWQSIQLQNLQRYRRESRKIVQESGKAARLATEELLTRKGGKFAKVEALIEAVTGDMEKAEHAAFRLANDVYRQTIYRAQIYLDTGTMTLKQAVDMATMDFLNQGINCVLYADGRRVNIASYAEMSLRTASQRATFMADGLKRDQWGIHTIFVSAHANACDLCLPWQGKILIDDVFSAGRPDGKHKLLSEAIEANLLHPNCRHTLATYFPGVTELPEVPDEELARKNHEAEQKQRYMERQVRKWKRRAVGSLDKENQVTAKKKVREWQKRIREHLKENPQLRRDYHREKIFEVA
jgi:cellobiose-specific phosphotransferase system component IIA